MASSGTNGDPRSVMLEQKTKQSPATRKLLRVGGVAAGVLTLIVGGALTGFTLLLASPLLLLFSPVLVPLAVLAGLALAGCLMFVSCAAWAYKYYKGRHPVGSRQVDAAKARIVDAASQLSGKAREVGSNVSDNLSKTA